MPWNGSGSFARSDGTFSGTTVWAQNKSAGVLITTGRHDVHDEDLADGIEACLTKNGENSPSADLPMATFKHLNVGAATARTQYARASQVQDAGFIWGGTSSGAANVYAISLTPAITAYSNGQTFAFKAHQSNTGAVTLNVNSVGAKAVRRTDGVSALVADDIANGQIVYVIYDPGDFFVITNRQTLDILSATQLKFATGFNILGSTADGSDTQSLTLSSAGAIANGRSARVTFYGADHATNAGQARIVGDGGGIFLETVTSSFVDISIAGNSTWTFESDGDLANNSSTGGNLVVNRNTKGLVVTHATVAAAGSNKATATALTALSNKVTSGTGWVALPASIPAGAFAFIHNETGSAITVAPNNNGTDKIQGSVGATTSVAAHTSEIFFRISSDDWQSRIP